MYGRADPTLHHTTCYSKCACFYFDDFSRFYNFMFRHQFVLFIFQSHSVIASVRSVSVGLIGRVVECRASISVTGSWE